VAESPLYLQAAYAKVEDPILGMIVAINMYLQAYHMNRAAALNKPLSTEA
jgi:hypothetical protein